MAAGMMPPARWAYARPTGRSDRSARTAIGIAPIRTPSSAAAIVPWWGPSVVRTRLTSSFEVAGILRNTGLCGEARSTRARNPSTWSSVRSNRSGRSELFGSARRRHWQAAAHVHDDRRRARRRVRTGCPGRYRRKVGNLNGSDSGADGTPFGIHPRTGRRSAPCPVQKRFRFRFWNCSRVMLPSRKAVSHIASAWSSLGSSSRKSASQPSGSPSHTGSNHGSDSYDGP